MTCDWCQHSQWQENPARWIAAFGNNDMEVWVCGLCDYHYGMISDRDGDHAGIYAPLAKDDQEPHRSRFAVEWEVRQL